MWLTDKPVRKTCQEKEVDILQYGIFDVCVVHGRHSICYGRCEGQAPVCKHIHEHKSAIGRCIGVVDSFLKGEHSSFLCAKAKSMLSVQPVFKGLKISLPRYIRLIAFLWNSVAFFDIISPHFRAVVQLVYANHRVLEKPHFCGLPLIQITPCKRRTPAFPAPADTVPRSAPCGKRSNILCFFLVCKSCGEKQSTTSFPVKIFG